MTQNGIEIASLRTQSISHGAVVVTVASGIFVVSGYVVNVWLGRLLGPEDYGRFGIVIGLLTVLNVIQNSALPQAVARAAAEDPERAEGTLWRGVHLQMAIAVFMAATLIVGASAIARLLGDRQLADLLLLAALALPPYGLFTLLMAFHSGLRRYDRQAFTLAIYAVAKAFSAIGLAYVFRVRGVVLGYLIAALVGVVAGWHQLWGSPSRIAYRRLIGFAGPLSVYAVASVGQMSVDIFFVKAMISDPDVAGYYAASQNVARIPYYLMSGLAAIILPAVAAAAQRGPAMAAGTAGQALRWAMIVVFPTAGTILATSRPLIELLYSSRYNPSADLLPLLGPAMGAMALSAIVAGILSGLGRPAASAILAVVGLAVTALACVVLIPGGGLRGAGLSTLLGSGVALVGMIVVLQRVAPGALPILSGVRVAASAAIVSIGAWILAAEGAALVLVYVGLGASVMALLVAMRELTTDDLRRLVVRQRSRDGVA